MAKPQTNVIVDIDWIRHGYSCANLLQDMSKIASAVRPVITSDAVLSDPGVNQAKSLNTLMRTSEYKNHYDILLCSSMRRAMETAMFAFNDPSVNKKLRVVPFISEARHVIAKTLNIDLENVPLGTKYLFPHYQQIRKDYHRDIGNVTVDFSILQKYEDAKVDLSPNYDKFISLVLPQVIKDIGRPKNPDGVYRIAIVSHNHFISHHFEKYGVHGIKNTEMWRERLNLRDTNGKYSVVNFQVSKPFCPSQMSLCYVPNCKGNSLTCQVWQGQPPPEKPSGLGRCEKYHSNIYRKVGQKFAPNNSSSRSPSPDSRPPMSRTFTQKPELSKSEQNMTFKRSKIIGGNDEYYLAKYLKYKTKYMELKNTHMS